MDWEFIADKYSTNPQDTLYHYTSSDGLKGILETDTIRATDFGYLNDKSEMLHGIEIFKKASSTIKKQDLKIFETKFDYYDDYLKVIKDINFVDDIFVCSFSTKKNCLNQWRAYTPKEGGYSIGFSSKDLAHHAYESKCRLFKCLYKYEDQLKLAKKILGDLLYFFDSNQQNYDVSKSTFATHIRSAVKFFCPILKNYAFKDESEWRLVTSYRTLNAKDVCFISKNETLVPYISIDLKNVNIPEIWVGPGMSSDLRDRSIRRFIDVYNIDTEIKNSLIPLR